MSQMFQKFSGWAVWLASGWKFENSWNRHPREKVASLINELLPKSIFCVAFSKKNWMPLCSKIDFWRLPNSQIRNRKISSPQKTLSCFTAHLQTPHGSTTCTRVGWVKWVLSPPMSETSSFTPKPREPTAMGVGTLTLHLKRYFCFLKKSVHP